MKSFFKSSRALLVGALLLLVAAVAAGGALHWRNLAWFDMTGFERSAGATLDRLDELAERAETFDQDEALEQLGAHPRNGFVLRLDDELDGAQGVFPETIPAGDEAGEQSKRAPTPSDFNLQFEGNDPYELLPRGCEATVEWGRLNVATGPSGALETRNILEIRPADLASVELELRAESGPFLDLILIKGNDQGMQERFSHRVHLVADGEFHTYRVEVDPPVESDTRQRYLAFSLVLGSMPESRLEIESIRFVSRGERFAASAYGRTEETKNDRLRPALYMKTPGSLTWAMSLPEAEKLTFRSGLGVFDPDAVEFRVEVAAADAPAAGGPAPVETVLRRTIHDPRRWEDVKVDLSAWAGRPVRVTLATDSKEPNTAFWTGPIVYGPPKEHFNVIVVLEDTFRADRASLYGNERPTTPYKDQLAGESVVFDRALVQATQTRPSIPNILTSLHGTATGVWSQITHDTLPESYLTLPEVLRAQGFDTQFLCLNVNGGPSSNVQQGFDEVQLPWAYSARRARPVYEEGAKPWIEAHRDRNFFLYIHLLDPHGIYDPPESDRQWFREVTTNGAGTTPVEPRPEFDPEWDPSPTWESRRARYDGEIAYNDREFGRFWEWIKAEGLDENTLFVFLSDHGEYIGERGFLGHEPPPVYLPVAHVPLMMRLPGVLPEGRRIATPVQLIDLMPTVLELAGVETDPLLMAGDTLLPLVETNTEEVYADRIVVTEELNSRSHALEETWAGVTWRGKRAIHSKAFEGSQGGWRGLLPDAPAIRSYDLTDDPEETRDGVWPNRDPFFQRRVHRFLEAFRARNAAIHEALGGDTTGAAIDLDSKALEQLRNLGYLK